MSNGAGALAGQTVVVIGGSGGIGLETARLARAQGADVVLTGRNPERLEKAASEVGAESTAAFDAADEAALEAFFADLRRRSTTSCPPPVVRTTGPCPSWTSRRRAARSTTTSGSPSTSPSSRSARCGRADRCCS